MRKDIRVIITRENSLSKGTEGNLVIEGVKHSKIFTLEEPWQDNHNGVSCIPTGNYNCVPHGWEKNSTFHQTQCWEITKVPNRTGILIHSGNTIKDIQGCCLVGMSRDIMDGLPAVLQSRVAMALLRNLIGNRSFELVIQGE